MTRADCTLGVDLVRLANELKNAIDLVRMAETEGDEDRATMEFVSARNFARAARKELRHEAAGQLRHVLRSCQDRSLAANRL